MMDPAVRDATRRSAGQTVQARRENKREAGQGALPPGPAGNKALRAQLTPLQATQVCLALSFVFSARARRDEYWGFHLVGAAALALVALVDFLAPHGLPRGAMTLSLAVLLAPASLAAGWRRMHDIDRAGWLSLLHVLVFAGGQLGAVAVAMAANDATTAEDPGMSVFAASAVASGAALLAWLFVVSRLLRPTFPRNNRWGNTPNV